MREEEVRTAAARARAALPRIRVDDDTFFSHLTRVFGDDLESRPLSEVVIEDLYLACACATHAPGAAAELRHRYGDAIRSAIARAVAPSEIDDVEQQLLDRLLVGSRGSRPKIATYTGQAPLAHWLRVVAHRAALMWARANGAENRARRRAAAEPLASSTHPEIAYLRDRYRGAFEDALKAALGKMEQRGRVLLRLHLVNGMGTLAIGKMYGVSQSTASRWLVRARGGLLDDLKASLATQGGVSSHELPMVAALVASRLDVSLGRLLRTDEQTKM